MASIRRSILSACALVLAAAAAPAHAIPSDVHVVVGTTRTEAGDRFDVFFVDTLVAGKGEAIWRPSGSSGVTIDITCTSIFSYPYFPPQKLHRAYASGLGSDSQTYRIVISDDTIFNSDSWTVTTATGEGPCGTPTGNSFSFQTSSLDFSVTP